MNSSRALLALVLGLPLSAQNIVQGTVVDQGSHEGIPGVKVRFFSADTGAHETLTDPTGRFAFPNLAAGSYYVGVEKQGYAQPGEADALGGRLATMRFSGAGTETVRFEMQRYGSLRGRIVNEDGQPVGGVRVSLMPPDLTRGTVFSEPDGSFVFQDLRPGSYRMIARPKSDGRGPGGGRMADVPTYYPGTTDPDAAQPMALGASADVSGIELRLQRAAMYRVSGLVLDSSGKPAVNVPVRLHKKSDGPGNIGNLTVGRMGAVSFYLANPNSPSAEISEPVMTSEDGRFSFIAPEGDWIVEAATPMERIAGTREDRENVADREISVRRSDDDSLELRLAPTFGFRIRAEIAGEIGGNADFVPPVILRPQQAGRPPVFGQPEARGSNSGASIQFQHVREGSYTVISGGLGGPDGLYLAALYIGGRDTLGQPFYLTPGAAEGRAVFRKATGGLQGSIDGGAPATILVIPASLSGDAGIAAVESKSDKPFTLSGLAPGDYQVIAFDRIVPVKLTDPSFVATAAGAATRVKVEDALVSVTLRVNPWPDSGR